MLVNYILCDTSTCKLLIDSGMQLCNIFRITVHRKSYKTEIKVSQESMTTISDPPTIFETAQGSLARKTFARKLFKCDHLSLFIITKLFLKSESLLLFKLN